MQITFLTTKQTTLANDDNLLIKQIKKLVKEKKYSEALKSGTEYLQKVPNNPDVLFIVGGIYYMNKKYKTAISYFEKSPFIMFDCINCIARWKDQII